ncbi:MAG TPA: DUF2341 domain-containing protein [Verrucomicrobiae bacterium]|jgi:hypothetical protein|nr:DUF2341 domain-containing protein [Verrucomicrobiae bacterium]
MQRKAIAGVLTAALTFVAGLTVQAQSPYSQAVTSLNPVGYWPLNETVQPPQPFAQSLVASNLGSLGAAGSGYYGAWYQPSGNTWYLTNNIMQVPAVTAPFDNSVAMVCGGPGQYVIVPRNTNGVANPAITLNPPFSIETWLKIGRTTSALGDIVSQGGFANLNTGGSNPTNQFYGGPSVGAWAGVELGQYQDYIFLICQATNAQSKANELDSSAYNAGKGFHVGDWVHIVATFDGTKETLYTNGVLCASKNIGNNGAGIKYVPDPTTPLMIGSGSEVSVSYGTPYVGDMHDVAIYPTALTASSVLTHYQTAYGTNGTYGSSYPTAVLADNPSLYYRLNDPQTATNAGYNSASFPVANNYGVIGAAGNGVYQPGTTPGVAGAPYSGFGANNRAVAINGWFGAVDVGGGNLPAELNPTNTSPLTVVSWFRGNPADSPARFQEIVGHGDNSYRLALSQTAADNHFNPGPGPELGFTDPLDVRTNGWALNDGAWHMVAGVSDGTNDYLYLDGVLAKSGTKAGGINIVGSPTDLLLGGDSQYTYASTGTYNSIRNFDGEVGQVAFWTNALSMTQIQTLFNAAQVPPLIHLQPAGVTNNQGQSVSLTTKFTGSSLTYQWYINNAPFGGQTNATLSLNPANFTNSGSYYVIASNPYGNATSAVVNVQIFGPPTIQAQSQANLQIFAGVNPTLFINAGGPSLQYQWTSNGIAIAGATGPTYTINNAQVSATYNVTVYNFAGTNMGSPVSLTVVPQPTAPYPQAVLADGPIAYYRLDETSGTTAFDMVGGYNGIYTNVALASDTSYSAGGGTANSDPNELAPEFGTLTSSNSYVGWIPTNLDFAVPNGGNGEFSVELWGYEFLDFTDSGLVALGYGNGGEEFALDLGATGHALRFYVRNAAGTSFGAASTYVPNTGWHHIAAVCDEAAGHTYLYVDGVVVATGTIPAGSGILSEKSPLSIGARQSGQFTAFDDQFIGNLSQVALYKKALTQSEVIAHYDAVGIAPTAQIVPDNLNTNQGANVTFTVSTTGTGPFSYQWADNSGNPVGTNGPALTLLNVQGSQAGQYSVTVTGADGSTTAYANLQVGQGPPAIVTDISPLTQTVELYSGLSRVSFSVGASGTAPFSYQWYQNGQKINGATSNTYTFNALAGTNTYYVAVTNSQSGGVPTLSSTATVIGIAPPMLNPASYAHRLKITFPGYLGSPLTNFPALVTLSPSIPGFSYGDFSAGNGADLRFTDESGTAELPYEIDEWNPAGASKVWVQIPLLNGSNIWAYWGNSADTNAQAWSTDGSVWTPEGYQIVYHLKEGALPFADSTGQHPATNGPAPTAGTGIVGRGGLFNASYISPGAVTLSNQFTTYAWINLPANTTQIQTIWANAVGGFGGNGFALFVDSYNTGDLSIHAANGNGAGGGEEPQSSAGTVTTGQWHQVAATWDQPDNSVVVYLDNQLVLSNTVVQNFALTNTLELGSFVDGAFAFHGSMDEARIQFGIASQAWIAATYANIANNASFISYGVGPTLTIVPSGNGYQISWSAADGPLQLITTTSLTPPIDWTPVTTTPTLTNGQYVVQVQAEAGTSHFFALQ